jgi:hypothetical protein
MWGFRLVPKDPSFTLSAALPRPRFSRLAPSFLQLKASTTPTCYSRASPLEDYLFVLQSLMLHQAVL